MSFVRKDLNVRGLELPCNCFELYLWVIVARNLTFITRCCCSMSAY